jgi:hypothetical protein
MQGFASHEWSHYQTQQQRPETGTAAGTPTASLEISDANRSSSRSAGGSLARVHGDRRRGSTHTTAGGGPLWRPRNAKKKLGRSEDAPYQGTLDSAVKSDAMAETASGHRRCCRGYRGDFRMMHQIISDESRGRVMRLEHLHQRDLEMTERLQTLRYHGMTWTSKRMRSRRLKTEMVWPPSTGTQLIVSAAPFDRSQGFWSLAPLMSRAGAQRLTWVTPRAS